MSPDLPKSQLLCPLSAMSISRPSRKQDAIRTSFMLRSDMALTSSSKWLLQLEQALAYTGDIGIEESIVDKSRMQIYLAHKSHAELSLLNIPKEQQCISWAALQVDTVILPEHIATDAQADARLALNECCLQIWLGFRKHIVHCISNDN